MGARLSLVSQAQSPRTVLSTSDGAMVDRDAILADVDRRREMVAPHEECQQDCGTVQVAHDGRQGSGPLADAFRLDSHAPRVVFDEDTVELEPVEPDPGADSDAPDAPIAAAVENGIVQAVPDSEIESGTDALLDSSGRRAVAHVAPPI